MTSMAPAEGSDGSTQLVFVVPTRGKCIYVFFFTIYCQSCIYLLMFSTYQSHFTSVLKNESFHISKNDRFKQR